MKLRKRCQKCEYPPVDEPTIKRIIADRNKTCRDCKKAVIMLCGCGAEYMYCKVFKEYYDNIDRKHKCPWHMLNIFHRE